MPGKLSRRLAPCGALAVALVLVMAAAAPSPAAAQDYFGAAAAPMTFEVDKPRAKEAKILIGSLLGGAVVFAGGGFLFHLHSRNQSDEVSTRTDHHTGKVYTEELDATRRDAIRSGRFAMAGYALGGGFVVAAFVAYLVTDPGTETIKVGEPEEAPPPAGRPQVMVEPTDGGGLVGAAWSF